MNYLILIASFMLIGTGVGAETVPESMHTRQVVEELTQANQAVLKQYDSFADALSQVYQRGEGLIYRDVQKIFKAVAFSADKHRSQTRKDAQQTPYIIHPIGVTHTLLTLGKVRDADILIAGLLHDTVEDTATSFEEISQAFGPRVAALVREVTDDKSLPKHVRKQLQIEHAAEKSAGAAQIKLADKLYNLNDLTQSSPSDWDQERVDAYFLWAKQVVDHLPWVNAPLKNAVDEMIQAHLKVMAIL